MPVILIELNRLSSLGLAPHHIKKVKQAQASAAEVKEHSYHLPVGEVEQILNVTQINLATESKRGLFPTREGSGLNKYYDIRKIVRCFWDAIHSVGIDMEIKKEKHRKLVLENKATLGGYIDRETAEDRTVTLLRAITRMFIHNVKMASPMLTACPTPREAEKILMDQFKDIFNTLERESKRIEWSDEKNIQAEETEE